MIKYAITGNIASGKSVVQNFLQERGEVVLDTDLAAHKVLENNREVIDIFKGYDILDNGKISREKLGKIVFDDKIMLEKLNSVIHPLVKEEIIKFFEQNSHLQRVFVAIPLLFEANMQDLFDKIIFVYADDKIRLERLIARNGYTKEYAEKRIASQLPQTYKLEKADIVIENNGSIEELKTKLLAL